MSAPSSDVVSSDQKSLDRLKQAHAQLIESEDMGKDPRLLVLPFTAKRYSESRTIFRTDTGPVDLFAAYSESHAQLVARLTSLCIVVLIHVLPYTHLQKFFNHIICLIV